MDPNVSYEHMMAYQAGMEHSRSFDAFKRSREDPGMSMGMEGAYPTMPKYPSCQNISRMKRQCEKNVIFFS